MCKARLIAGLGALLAMLAAAPALAYDPSWYRSDGWGGEYPAGFTLTQSVSTKLRAADDPAAPRDIDCALSKGATYHPWNADRVAASGLQFVSYTRTVDYAVAEPLDTVVYRMPEGDEVPLSLAAGAEWTYLTYVAEGLFVMRYDGVIYQADQDLFEASKEAGNGAADDTPTDQWMKLTCDNKATGWMLLSEVIGQPGFDAPQITDYGKAADRP